MTKRFLPASNVRWAKILNGKPPFIHRKKSKGRFAVGVRYERKAHEELALQALGLPGITYIESPWIEFQDDNGRRWCQPDALLLSKPAQGVMIYEIKYRHCIDAWWQLTHLYEPVVKVLFPAYPITGRMEVVHWFDPEIQFPDGWNLTESPFLIPKRNRIAVCIFNPKARSRSRLSKAGPGGGAGDNQGSSQERRSQGPEPISAAGPCSGALVSERSCAVPQGAESSTSIAVSTKGD